MRFHPCLIAIAIALTALIPATSVLAGDDAIPDWPQWRGPDKDGISKDANWVTTGRDTPLWKRNVGIGYSNICLWKGRLITHGFDEAKEEDVVVCVDGLTGEEHWRFAYPSRKWDNMHEGGTLTTPVAEGEHVYVLSRLGTLHCLKVADGAPVWKRALDQDLGVELGPFGLPTTPLLLDEGMVVNVGKTTLLDKGSGETIWETEDYGYSYSVPVAFTRGERQMLAVFNAVGLVILDRASGQEQMRFPWTSQYNVNCATPIVMGSRVFISTGYNELGCAMLDLSKEQLEVEWQSKVMRNKMTGCVLYEDHLYGFDAAMLKCIDLEGNELWRERGLGTGAVLLTADGRMIVLSEDGELIIARTSSESFEELARTRVFEEGGKCWTTPVLCGGLIFCRNNKGDLVCLDHRASTS